jgi:hypothetical protein
MDQDGKPNLRRFSFDDDLVKPWAQEDLDNRLADLEKREKQLSKLADDLEKREKQISILGQVPALIGRIQVLNFIDGGLTSSSISGAQRSSNGLTVEAGCTFNIQMCCVRKFVGRIIDLYIKAPDYVGTIEFIHGDIRQFDGPIEMLNRYKGAVMKQAKCAIVPGCPCTLRGRNNTDAPILISEAALVMEIDPEWEKNEYRDW